MSFWDVDVGVNLSSGAEFRRVQHVIYVIDFFNKIIKEFLTSTEAATVNGAGFPLFGSTGQFLILTSEQYEANSCCW